MKKTLFFVMMLVFLLTACTPTTEPAVQELPGYVTAEKVAQVLNATIPTTECEKVGEDWEKQDSLGMNCWDPSQFIRNEEPSFSKTSVYLLLGIPSESVEIGFSYFVTKGHSGENALSNAKHVVDSPTLIFRITNEEFDQLQDEFLARGIED